MSVAATSHNSASALALGACSGATLEIVWSRGVKFKYIGEHDEAADALGAASLLTSAPQRLLRPVWTTFARLHSAIVAQSCEVLYSASQSKGRRCSGQTHGEGVFQ
jgi:hypothetical protein